MIFPSSPALDSAASLAIAAFLALATTLLQAACSECFLINQELSLAKELGIDGEIINGGGIDGEGIDGEVINGGRMNG